VNRVVEIARGWIGTPYLHQASCRGAGADCLGLVRGVWREFLGAEPVEVPPYAPDWDEVQRREALWAAAEAHLRPRAAAEPGDVLLFRMRDGAVAKHLGILSAGGAAPRFIHAYSGHGVVENSLSAPWRRRIVAAFAFPGGAD
jgi:NlpC/P60 family putative phage cell wall peptidase